jgi:hypothetical protein
MTIGLGLKPSTGAIQYFLKHHDRTGSEPSLVLSWVQANTIPFSAPININFALAVAAVDSVTPLQVCTQMAMKWQY